MDSIAKIHRYNLRLLIDTHYDSQVKKLADAIGASDSQVSQWLNGSRNSSTGKPRGISTGSCRRIEQAAHMPEGWMDANRMPRHMPCSDQWWFWQAVGERLREERERLGMGVGIMAAHGGLDEVHEQVLYEKGEREPSLLYLDGVERVGVDVLYVRKGLRTPGLRDMVHVWDVAAAGRRLVALTEREQALIDDWQVCDEAGRSAIERAARAAVEGAPAAFADPAPDPQAVVARFWQTFHALQEEGVQLNHSIDPNLIAINLPEFIKSAKDHKLKTDTKPAITKALPASKRPRFVKTKTIRSALLTDAQGESKTISCWVFKRDAGGEPAARGHSDHRSGGQP